MPEPPGTKRRPCCDETLPVEEFYPDPRRQDGRAGRCRWCDNAITRAYRRKHREAERERNRVWRRANPDKHRAKQRRYRQARRDEAG